MNRFGAFALSVVFSLFAAPLRAGEPSREELKKVLDKNPGLVIDVLRDNKRVLFEIVSQAAQEEQTRRQKEEADKEKAEFEESFKHPKLPAINSKTNIRGEKKAKYTLVEYSDFQCPHCFRGFQIVEKLREKYGAKLRFVYKNMPLTQMHPMALPAAQWLEAAAIQSPEKAWKFHDTLFNNQAKISEDFLKTTAKELDLDVKKIEADAKSKAVQNKIEADMAEARKFGFNGTPGFLINGIPVRGAYPVEFFDSIVQRLDSGKQ